MNLNIHCSLANDRFTVSKLSFRRMLERTNRVEDIADISLEAESAMLTTRSDDSSSRGTWKYPLTTLRLVWTVVCPLCLRRCAPAAQCIC